MNLTLTDEQRFVELVNENRNRILKVCRVYARNPADQDDLYQEILFQIWRALPGLKDNAYANTWLYRVAINTSISFVRRRTSKVQSEPIDHAELARRIEAQQPDDAGISEQLARLYEAIAQLNDMEKATMTLFLEELSYEEISDVLGIDTSHVGVILHRTKKKLSQWMKGDPA